MSRRIRIIGPAYLDRVLRVDRPLVDPLQGGPLDLSVEGEWTGATFGPSLLLRDPAQNLLKVEIPEDWSIDRGEIRLNLPLIPGKRNIVRTVQGIALQDDLGGMGAGFAAALGGELVHALGAEGDPNSQSIVHRLEAEKIVHTPIRQPNRTADWTLLITSGSHGDKLPVGFRGCHAAIHDMNQQDAEPVDLLLVASLTNRLVASVLKTSRATIKVFAPTLRNMRDLSPSIARFASQIDVLVCNRKEWEALEGREAIAEHVPMLSITDGPAGSRLRFQRPEGGTEELDIPVFPRSRPPVDTNRAGEAYASTLLKTLLDAGWVPGPTDSRLAQTAALNASIAAALVLDRQDFGFPSEKEIQAALRRSFVV